MHDLTSLWLTRDGDTRIELDADTGLNPYGCPPYPDPGLLDFGSATASVISEAGFGAAAALRRALLPLDGGTPSLASLWQETERVSEELLQLNGLTPTAGVTVFLTASGTDAHRLASMFAWTGCEHPPSILSIAPDETGRGVPEALVAPCNGAFLPLAVRDSKGQLRPQAVVENEALDAAGCALADGRPLFVVLTDVSKTGLVFPGALLMQALRQASRKSLRVLVDASQFRLSSTTLNDYLEQGFMVALTGSKFMGGPSFSGALLVPRQFPGRLDLPRPPVLPLGQLLRWEAALTELRRFKALQAPEIRAFLEQFASGVTAHMAQNPQVEPIPSLPPDRISRTGRFEWDCVQTIFPFLLRRLAEQGGSSLSPEETLAVFRQIPQGGMGRGTLRGRLAQPVSCGMGRERAVSALRLCVGARHVVEAIQGGLEGRARVVAHACALLDHAAQMATTIRAIS